MKPQNWDFRKFAIFWRKFGIPVQQKNLLVVVGIFKKCLNFVATGQTTPDLTFPGSGNVKSGVVGIFKIQKVLKFGTFKKHQNLAKNQGVTTQIFSNSRAPNLELQMRQKPITICHFCDPVGTPPGPAADDPKMPGKSQTVMG